MNPIAVTLFALGMISAILGFIVSLVALFVFRSLGKTWFYDDLTNVGSWSVILTVLTFVGSVAAQITNIQIPKL